MNELYHHGIKGMHWGIRRFQNPDGTLTAAGRKRNSSIKSDRQLRREAKRQRTWNAKNASQLSDKELTDQILRLQREKQLKDLTRQSVTPGKKHAHELLQRYMDQALGAAVTTAVTVYATKKLGEKLNPDKSEYDKQYEQMRARMDAEKRIAREGGFSARYDAQGNPIHRGGNR